MKFKNLSQGTTGISSPNYRQPKLKKPEDITLEFQANQYIEEETRKQKRRAKKTVKLEPILNDTSQTKKKRESQKQAERMQRGQVLFLQSPFQARRKRRFDTIYMRMQNELPCFKNLTESKQHTILEILQEQQTLCYIQDILKSYDRLVELGYHEKEVDRLINKYSLRHEMLQRVFVCKDRGIAVKHHSSHIRKLHQDIKNLTINRDRDIILQLFKEELVGKDVEQQKQLCYIIKQLSTILSSIIIKRFRMRLRIVSEQQQKTEGFIIQKMENGLQYEDYLPLLNKRDNKFKNLRLNFNSQVIRLEMAHGSMGHISQVNRSLFLNLAEVEKQKSARRIGKHSKNYEQCY